MTAARGFSTSKVCRGFAVLCHFLWRLGVFFPLPGQKAPFEEIKAGKAHFPKGTLIPWELTFSLDLMPYYLRSATLTPISPRSGLGRQQVGGIGPGFMVG